MTSFIHSTDYMYVKINKIFSDPNVIIEFYVIFIHFPHSSLVLYSGTNFYIYLILTFFFFFFFSLFLFVFSGQL